VVITSSEPPRAMVSSASRRALPRTVPSRRTHGMRRFSSFSCWSRSSASSGEMTTTGFGMIIDGIW
jgi:hypothetical protein